VDEVDDDGLVEEDEEGVLKDDVEEGGLPAWANAEAVPSKTAHAATERREGDWIGCFILRFGTRGAAYVPPRAMGVARIAGWFDVLR
jgi:hypothetical protein